jgi:ribosomal protein S18 acetylase RimI-like enzyme
MVSSSTVLSFITPLDEEWVREAHRLFQEYATSLAVDLCFQSFDQELAGLPGRYAPPEGRLLLAWCDGELAGCVALRSLGDGICEMKRLYVRPAFRGRGIGRLLIDRIISEAVGAGYSSMRLDTLPSMGAALDLYRERGFREIPPYTTNPVPGAVFLERDLRTLSHDP